MLPKAHRLRKTKDIEVLFKQGKSAYCGSLGIKLHANQLAYPRFTILVNKKVSKKAVDRNRLKRCLRELLKQKLKPGLSVDLLTICQPSALTLDQKDLECDLDLVLSRLRLI